MITVIDIILLVGRSIPNYVRIILDESQNNQNNIIRWKIPGNWEAPEVFLTLCDESMPHHFVVTAYANW